MPRWNRDKTATIALEQAITLFMLDREQAGCATPTLIWYRKHLTVFAQHCEMHNLELQNLTGDDIRRWIIGLRERGLAPRTVHHHASAVRTLFLYLVTQKYLTEQTNPMRTIKMPRLPKTKPPCFTKEEFIRLLEVAPSQRDRAALLFLADTGVRASEFCALTIGDINLKTGVVQVRQGKGKKDRTVFLGAHARKALVDYLAQRPPPPPTEHLWLSYDQTPLTYTGLKQALERMGKKTNVPACAPHKFRRTFAMWSLRAGMDLVRLAAIMGHTSLTVLQGYLAYLEDDLQAAHHDHGAVDKLLSR